MKTCRYILFVFYAVIMISCQKEIKEPNISYLIKTKTHPLYYPPVSFNTETYIYDSLNRLVKITNSAFSSYTTFQFINDTLFEYHHENNDSTIKSKYQLNSIGLITQRLQASPFRITEESEDFYYDNAHFLKYYNYGAIDAILNDTILNNGLNIIQKHELTDGLMGKIWWTTIYKYYPHYNTLGNFNFGKLYLGYSSTNLIQSETTLSYHPDFIPPFRAASTTSYTYEFDNYGRVLTQYAKTDTLPTIKTMFTYY